LLVLACGEPGTRPQTQDAPPGTPAAGDAQPASPTATPTAPIELIEEGFLGQFNIIRAGKRYYSLAQDEGAFDQSKAERGDYVRFFIADDLNRVKLMTQDGVNAGFGPTATMLVDEGYKGTFNIIRHQGAYYALPQGAGTFDPKNFKDGYRGTSLQDVKRQIP
jgi:hypothetical protein